MNGETSTAKKEIQNISKECFKSLYSIKLRSLKEMDKFLDAAESLILNQEEVNNLNKPTTNEEIEVVISLPTKNSAVADGFTAKFFHTFNKDLWQILK